MNQFLKINQSLSICLFISLYWLCFPREPCLYSSVQCISVCITPGDSISGWVLLNLTNRLKWWQPAFPIFWFPTKISLMQRLSQCGPQTSSNITWKLVRNVCSWPYGHTLNVLNHRYWGWSPTIFFFFKQVPWEILKHTKIFRTNAIMVSSIGEYFLNQLSH